MSWGNRMKAIATGDKVCYSRTFLRSTGQMTGDVPHARGEVTAILSLGETQLACIRWDTPDLPEKVNIANLSRITHRGIEEPN